MGARTDTTDTTPPAETRPVTCGFKHSLSSAAELVWEHQCRSISVVDADGHQVGVVTDLHVWAAHNHGVPLDTIRLVDLVGALRERGK